MSFRTRKRRKTLTNTYHFYQTCKLLPMFSFAYFSIEWKFLAKRERENFESSNIQFQKVGDQIVHALETWSDFDFYLLWNLIVGMQIFWMQPRKKNSKTEVNDSVYDFGIIKKSDDLKRHKIVFFPHSKKMSFFIFLGNGNKWKQALL